ncbi:MAG: 30S ribosomal protein S17 [Acetomicrobium sp.]|jgi:small subunit ribosomal protein S17|uniref:30S ribosomal protein S17 n=1 Tax=Acetomicrobium TaxID=49894 RepID=UPI0016B1B5E1|nr:30S ribosomal protein S17 [Acetomicrobium mobile]MDI9377817.1 30S ribosomal protein S17 [Synergistota bacterium]NLI43735.1 30S ribosomal protein S17 [Synergistaceae bacterium]HOB11091.1 30S ribosomal protein S17 [Acetomicrobium sp.]HOM97912.1 30S ribosomal protein S17 [Acetomicrobium sp.]HQA36909.1 30S ribosomal protein S17 [Acetomicrobium sp.]
MEGRKAQRKVKRGIVVSSKMDKTVVVRVDRIAKHAFYHKPVLKSKKFMAHDEENACLMGDKVLIEETRPLSRRKRWKVVKILERAPLLEHTEAVEEE